MTGEWRKLHNEELHDVYCPLDFVWATSSERLRSKEKFKWNLVQNLKEKDHFGNLDVDGKITSKLVNKNDMSLNTTKL